MAEMTVEQAVEKYGPGELTRDDLLVLDDPNFDADSVAIVTGASSGIGRATALAYAANGLTVVGTGQREANLQEVQAEARDMGLPGRIVPVTGNLAEESALEGIVEEAADLGSIRYLANVAGVQHVAPIDSFPIDQYDAMHDVMQRAPLVLTKHCLPHFRENEDGGGVVGNMCSVHGHIVTRDKVAYNMTKFALRGLTQSIAAEGDGDVRAFTVSTAYVKTPLVAKQLPATADRRGMTVDEVVEKVMLERTRVKEMMEPYEVANLFVMGSSRYSTHLDGGDMTHEGGMSLTY